MTFIFMDESGCLGFDPTKKASSKNFLITFLITENKRSLEKLVKSIFQSMFPNERKRHCGVLHATKEQKRHNRKLLLALQKKFDVRIMVIRLNKNKVYAHLKNEKRALYNYITNILIDRLVSNHINSTHNQFTLIASKRETKELLNENFMSYLKGNYENKLNLEVIIKTPSQEKCLQIADLISWSIFRYYEFQDDAYYNIIKGLIVEDKTLF